MCDVSLNGDVDRRAVGQAGNISENSKEVHSKMAGEERLNEIVGEGVGFWGEVKLALTKTSLILQWKKKILFGRKDEAEISLPLHNLTDVKWTIDWAMLFGFSTAILLLFLFPGALLRSLVVSPLWVSYLLMSLGGALLVAMVGGSVDKELKDFVRINTPTMSLYIRTWPKSASRHAVREEGFHFDEDNLREFVRLANSAVRKATQRTEAEIQEECDKLFSTIERTKSVSVKQVREAVEAFHAAHHEDELKSIVECRIPDKEFGWLCSTKAYVAFFRDNVYFAPMEPGTSIDIRQQILSLEDVQGFSLRRRALSRYCKARFTLSNGCIKLKGIPRKTLSGKRIDELLEGVFRDKASIDGMAEPGHASEAVHV